MPRLEYLPVIGLPLAQGWSQIVSNRPGNCLISLAVAGPNASNWGKDLVNQIEATDLNSAPVLHQLILDLIAQARQHQLELKVAGCLQEDGKLFLVTYYGQIILRRQSQSPAQNLATSHLATSPTKIGTILSSTSELQLVSGRWHPGDTLVLATPNSAALTQLIKNQLATPAKIEALATNLVSLIQNQADSSTVAIALINFSAPAAPTVVVAPPAPTPVVTPTTFGSQPWAAKTNPPPTSTQQIIDRPPVDQQLNPASSNQIDSVSPIVKPNSSTLLHPYLTKISWFNKLTHQIISLFKKMTWPNLKQWPLINNFRRFSNSASRVNQSAATSLNVSPDASLSSTNSPLAVVTLAKQWPKQLPPIKWQPTNWLANLSRPRPIYVKSPRSRQLAKWLGLFCLVLLIIGGSWGWWRQQRAAQQQQLAELIQPSTNLLTKANELKNQDIIAARDQAQQALTNINQLLTDHPAPKLINQGLLKQQAAVTETIASLAGNNQLSQLQVFADLREINADFVASAIVGNPQFVFLADFGRQKLIQIQLNDRQHRLIDLPANSRSLAASQEKLFVLAADGIYQTTITDLAAPTTAWTKLKDAGDSDQQATLINIFNDYLYVFNPDKRNIYRYVLTKKDEPLATPIGWLIDKKGIDFTTVNSWCINGLIWLTDKTGQVFKLEKGQPISFNLTNFSAPNSSIYIGCQNDQIFLLEPKATRLITLNDQGQFIEQFVSPSLASTTGLFIPDGAKMALTISGSLVFQINL